MPSTHPQLVQVDSQYQVVYTDALQLKVSAMKTVVFAAGSNRHLDFFLNFFDYLVCGPQVTYQHGGANFIFPEWQRTSAPSTTLSNVMKALLPSSKNVKYAKFRVTGLHEDASAGGIRVGAVNWLTSHMPAEFVAYLTGHTLTGIGALFEYLRVAVSLFYVVSTPTRCLLRKDLLLPPNHSQVCTCPLPRPS